MVKKTEFYRLLKPSEVLKIESEIKNSDLRMSFKTAVNTGMRYKELQLFAEHPEWFNHNRNIIIIPKKFTKTQDERKVNLTPQFSELLYYFLHSGHRLKYSVYQSWSANLRRWAALAGVEHPEDLSAGSTRKAWESWLIESGWPLSRILASQGHDMNTSMKHYYNNDVTPEERIKMKEMTQGWGQSITDMIPKDYVILLSDIKQRVRSAQYEALKAVNKELISLYWDIGQMIVERQKGKTWGKSVVEQLAKDLQIEFPGMQGFSSRNIWRMRSFHLIYEVNPKLPPLVAENRLDTQLHHFRKVQRQSGA